MPTKTENMPTVSIFVVVITLKCNNSMKYCLEYINKQNDAPLKRNSDI